MRRDDLMKSDLLSEAVLRGGCVLLLLTLIVALGKLVDDLLATLRAPVASEGGPYQSTS
jgi:hypothetical protein